MRSLGCQPHGRHTQLAKGCLGSKDFIWIFRSSSLSPPGRVVLSVVACGSCPSGVSSTWKKEANVKVTVLRGRPSQLGSSAASGFLPGAPTGAQLKSFLSPCLLLLPWGRWHLFPGDTLSQSVGGGRGKGLCGKQRRWMWGCEGGESHSLCTSLLLPPLP